MNKSDNTFVIVYHIWWMDDGRFEEETIEAENRKAAEQYASAKCYKNQSTFKR